MANFNPVVPTQPNKEQYGVDQLYTSPRLTRPIYEEMFGEQAPAYDPKRQIKRWFFTNVLEGSVDPTNELCEVTVYASKDTIRKITMTKADCASVNLPGVYVYPKYNNPTSSFAVVLGPMGDRQPIGGQTLVDLTKAKYVVDEMNAALHSNYKLVAAEVPYSWTIVWGFESRRRMNITNGENLFDAAAILESRFAKGLGAPGSWVDQGLNGPAFIPDVPADGAQDVRPEIPMPCRELLANEKFNPVTFGGMGGQVLRTDLGAAAASGNSAVDSELIKQIAADTKAIRGAIQV